MHKHKLKDIIWNIYDELIVSKSKDQSFWILIAFIPTFILARLLVRLSPSLFLQVGNYHIHHFTYGFILLAIAGYLAIIRKGRSPIWLALIYGIGLALAVDETGMWLHLTSRYYNDTSEDTIILVVSLLISFVYFKDFWMRLLQEMAGKRKSVDKTN